MNREILFRGKRVDNGEWFYGTGIVPVKHNTHDTDKWELVEKVNYDELDYFMPSYYSEEIDINTLGRYTGLTDKNGKKIFEGDIILFNTSEYGELEKRHKAVVKYDKEYNRFAVFKNGAESYGVNMYLYNTEIIGNLHDGGNE